MSKVFDYFVYRVIMNCIVTHLSSIDNDIFGKT